MHFMRVITANKSSERVTSLFGLKPARLLTGILRPFIRSDIFIPNPIGNIIFFTFFYIIH